MIRLLCTHKDGRRFVYVPKDGPLDLPAGCWEVRAFELITNERVADERVR